MSDLPSTLMQLLLLVKLHARSQYRLRKEKWLIANISRRPPSMDEACAALHEYHSLDRRQKLEHLGTIIKVARSAKEPLTPQELSDLVFYLRPLLADESPVRAGTFRALRYLVHKPADVKEILRKRLHVYISRALEQQARQALNERMQALKLVQKMLQIDPGQVPRLIARSIIAIADDKDDQFRRSCLDTLRELAVLNIEVVAQCNGVKTLFDAVLDPSNRDKAEPLILTIMFLLNEAPKRQYVRPSLDLYRLMSTFSETDVVKAADRKLRWQASQNAIVTMLRSWTGLVLLTSDHFGLRALLDILKQQHEVEIQRAVLDTVCEVFYVPKSGAYARGGRGGRGGRADGGGGGDMGMNMEDGYVHGLPQPAFGGKAQGTNEGADAGTNAGANAGGKPNEPDTSSLRPHNLLDNYMAMVVLAFGHCGLIEALTTLGMGSNAELASTAVTLLSMVLRLALRLLPEAECDKMLAVPHLVEAAAPTQKHELAQLFARAQARRAHSMLTMISHAVGSGGSKRSSQSRPFGGGGGGASGGHQDGYDMHHGDSHNMGSGGGSDAQRVGMGIMGGRRGSNAGGSGSGGGGMGTDGGMGASDFVNGMHMAATLLQGSNRAVMAWNSFGVNLGMAGGVGSGNIPQRSRLHMMHDLKRNLDSQCNADAVRDLIARSRVTAAPKKPWQQWDW